MIGRWLGGEKEGVGGIFVNGAWRMAQMQRHTANERGRARRCPKRGRTKRCPEDQGAQRQMRRQRKRREKTQQNAREPEEAEGEGRRYEGRLEMQEVWLTVGVIRAHAVPSQTPIGLLLTDFLPLPAGAYGGVSMSSSFVPGNSVLVAAAALAAASAGTVPVVAAISA